MTRFPAKVTKGSVQVHFAVSITMQGFQWSNEIPKSDFCKQYMFAQNICERQPECFLSCLYNLTKLGFLGSKKVSVWWSFFTGTHIVFFCASLVDHKDLYKDSGRICVFFSSGNPCFTSTRHDSYNFYSNHHDFWVLVVNDSGAPQIGIVAKMYVWDGPQDEHTKNTLTFLWRRSMWIYFGCQKSSISHCIRFGNYSINHDIKHTPDALK